MGLLLQSISAKLAEFHIESPPIEDVLVELFDMAKCIKRDVITVKR